MLLAEYINANLESFRDLSVLELGAGAAVPSIIAGAVAASVTVTDVKRVLSLSRRSLEMNQDFLVGCSEARAIEMDWSREIRNFDRYYDVILAAECCYSRATCQNLFRLVEFLLVEEKPRQVLFAIEERPNFIKSSMSVKCTERDRNVFFNFNF